MDELAVQTVKRVQTYGVPLEKGMKSYQEEMAELR